MMHSIISFLRLPLLVLALFPAAATQAQEAAQKSNFYEVQMTKDEVYSYSNLKFKGDYTSFESPAGNLVLGRTEAGVTIVIVLGGGTLAIESPDAVQEKFTTVFCAYPLNTKFKTLLRKPPGLGLGMCPNERFSRSLRLEELDLEPGDAVVLYSDGITEAINGSMEQFGEERLMRSVERTDGQSAAETRAAILRDLEDFTAGTPARDDVTVVVLRVAGADAGAHAA